MAVESKSDETQVSEKLTVSQEKTPSEKGSQMGSSGIVNGHGELEKKEENKPKSGEVLGVEEKKKKIEGESKKEEYKSKSGEVLGMEEKNKKIEGEAKTGEAVEEKKIEAEDGDSSSSSVEKSFSLGEKKIETEEGESSSSSFEKSSSLDEKKIEAEEGESSSSLAKKSSSFREESNLLSDLKENEKKALIELKSKLEIAILGNELFTVKKTESSVEEGEEEKKIEKPVVQEGEEKKGLEQNGEEKKSVKDEADKKGKSIEEEGEKEKEMADVEPIDINIALWGVPLLPSKGDGGTDVILLKFLRAREFKVDEAFKMLKKTLQWRKENDINSLLNEEFGNDLSWLAYMDGADREGHPVCYNLYGDFGDDEMYKKTFGGDEQREKFLRWRFQLMEKGIQKLNFNPGGVSSLLQINDLKNTPGPSKKEIRLATRQAVDLLQDNYPEFVARNIFINVPFWYYAFYAVLSPFLTQRSKSKFVFARPARVTETLLKYIAAEEIPLNYGGLKRENDFEFSAEDGVLEVHVKAGSTENIEIPTPEAGAVTVWDLTVLGWEVNYKEEFVPFDEGSYTVIIQKGKKMGWQEEPTRNSFRNNEPGKIVLTIENGMFKRKRVLYRYKIKSSSSS